MNQPPLTYKTATIAINTSLSDAVFTGGQAICGIQMPAAWTAADITFQAACDAAANVANVYDKDGVELTIKAAASEFISLDPGLFAGVAFIKLRSGTAGTAVNQAAAASITLALRTA